MNNKNTIINPALPNIPWEEREPGSTAVVWRSQANPIIPHNLIPSSTSIFNSAVVPFEGAFAGVFRCDNKARTIHAAPRRQERRWRQLEYQ